MAEIELSAGQQNHKSVVMVIHFKRLIFMEKLTAINLLKVFWLSLIFAALAYTSNTYASNVAKETTLHIAVASNFKHTNALLVEAFKSTYTNPALKIISSSGSSGTLFAQITNGAPYDIFLSADASRPDTLIGLGLANKNRKIYAQGQIVLWQPQSKQAFDINILRHYPSPYALANPKLAPYGAASKALMLQYNLWKNTKTSRIVAHNIATVFQYLASGSVQIGWVAWSQLKAWEQKKGIRENSYWLPELNKYPAINQVAVQLKNAKSKLFAEQYLQFLSSEKAHLIIKSAGYLIPKE